MNELDDFDAIEGQGFKKSNVNFSNVYPVRMGGFGTTTAIRTYLTTLTVGELKSDVSLYDTLSNDKEWPISQIIQREVDKDRISEISKKYLLGQGRDVKYFPPIIVALLPRESDGSFSKVYNFTADQSPESKELIIDKSQYRSNTKFKELLISKDNESIIDGLYFFNTSHVFQHNILCWDKDKFYAVVIDGQHRLEALVKSQELDTLYHSAQQDVVFLDVSNLIREKNVLTPVQVLRTVFIDINTNARSVGLVRRILMDDKDLASLCVQSLVESVNKDGTSKLSGNFIPSILIDWYGDSLKHELPHITGLLTMHQIISDELVDRRLVSIEDHRDLNRIKDFKNILNNYFFVDHTIANDTDYQEITPIQTSFNEYLKERNVTLEIFAEELSEYALESILFTYDYRILDVAQKNFEKYYLRSIVQIFENIIPNIKVIEKLDSLGAFNITSNLYKALLSKRRKILEISHLKKAYIDARQILNSELNQQYYLLYTVVGQKAVFKTFFERLNQIFKIGSTEDTVLVTQKTFVSKFNSMLLILDSNNCFLFGKDEILIDVSDELEEYGTLASSFWEGILFEDKRIIYNSQGVRAFADIIKLIFEVQAKLESKPSIDDTDYQDLMSFSIRFSTQRTKRMLSKRFGYKTDLEWDRISNLILSEKRRYLIDQYSTAFRLKTEAKI
ncbi:hypothetical protein [Dyadobacter frigoris]|uniref:DGQHR domain-containing protein n=1 Tax=Dyadobacter frigoris TaxID=2576211 RepID=A0A4V6BMA1_9BACT|nr:hypothetical protein [Dyadobacter frigoris]TKT93343.1 hypothetical protein FDK13_05695 [Dyadobacter frigoris]